MARFFGYVGFGKTVEWPEDSGVWISSIERREYYGDVIRAVKKSDDAQTVNNNISINNSISIIADDYAVKCYSSIKYVEWDGGFWTVSSVEIRTPRLILSLGSVYNGPKI